MMAEIRNIEKEGREERRNIRQQSDLQIAAIEADKQRRLEEIDNIHKHNMETIFKMEEVVDRKDINEIKDLLASMVTYEL